jgi:hypothetical protein
MFKFANPHGVISHSTVTFTITEVGISDLTLKLLVTLFVNELLCAGMDIPGFEVRQRKDIFPPFLNVQIGCMGPIQPPVEWVPGFFRTGKATGA